MDSHHFMQALPWACRAAARARGRGDGQGKVACLPGVRWDRAQGEGAWAALGSDVHQGEAWQQGTGLLQDGKWGLGLQHKEKAPEPVEAEGTRALVSLVSVMM